MASEERTPKAKTHRHRTAVVGNAAGKEDPRYYKGVYAYYEPLSLV